MYINTLYPDRVRDRAATYGAGRPEAEEFPAEGVLRDLPDAPTGDVPDILARYAALRAWVLRAAGDDLAAHAESAARAHVSARPADWVERPALLGLIGGAGDDDTALLLDVAGHAERRGHPEGAAAVLLAGYRAARRRARLRAAGTLATALGRLLRGRGEPAEHWLGRGERLRRLADALPPPSPS